MKTIENLLIIRTTAIHVGKAVHCKSHIEVESKPEIEADPK